MVTLANTAALASGSSGIRTCEAPCGGHSHADVCIHDFISEYQKSTCKEQGAFCLPDL
jgi:hypothetical protein